MIVILPDFGIKCCRAFNSIDSVLSCTIEKEPHTSLITYIDLVVRVGLRERKRLHGILVVIVFEKTLHVL